MKTKKEQEFMKEMQDRYIRFDWAIKRLLRQKANFDVLEGFLTVFLGEKITIVELLESEGNQLSADDKFNRVDINYLKDGTIRPDTTAPGLGEAREKLRYYSMTPSERNAYDEHLSHVYPFKYNTNFRRQNTLAGTEKVTLGRQARFL